MRSEAAKRDTKSWGGKKRSKELEHFSKPHKFKSTVQLLKIKNNATHAQHLTAKVKKHQLWRKAPDVEGGKEGRKKKLKRKEKNNRSQQQQRTSQTKRRLDIKKKMTLVH
ncbi:hypothetical protein AMECASPLE_009950 [Ameca splendens]|uniref:Uncharacterized protein n=1 Tax=Ameca splendens TaxID=208324 RepID=A0ABV0YBE0_9TELE